MAAGTWKVEVLREDQPMIDWLHGSLEECLSEFFLLMDSTPAEQLRLTWSRS